MLTDVWELEQQATEGRIERNIQRAKRLEGYGSTEGGLAIVNRYLNQLEETLPTFIEHAREEHTSLSGIVKNLLLLNPRLLSLCALQTTLHSIGNQDTFGDTIRDLGAALEAECFRAKLTLSDKKTADEIEKRMEEARGGTRGKQTRARLEAERLGFSLRRWGVKHITTAGGWMLDWVLNAVPGAFEVRGEYEDKAVHLSEEALQHAEQAIGHLAEVRRVYLPLPEAPKAWEGALSPEDTGPFTNYRVDLVRTRNPALKALIREAIKDGSAAPCLEGLNALQGVAWRLNRPVLAVQKEIFRRSRGGSNAVWGPIAKKLGLPAPKAPRPERLGAEEWKAKTRPERNRIIEKEKHIRDSNSARISARLSLAEDWAACRLYRHKPFFVRQNMDWRGRVYGLARLNYQREDRVRGLFLFDRGEPLGEAGLDALRLHLANCWGGNIDPADKNSTKTDKLPTKEKLEWVVSNLTTISASATSPLTEHWWMKADAPWSFLAACIELVGALREGSRYVCHLPVAFDGSCSGVQHLALMTRSEKEARYVNLLPCGAPDDIYKRTADTAGPMFAEDSETPAEEWPTYKHKKTGEIRSTSWKAEVARMLLTDWQCDRSLTKRNTMTWSYGSTKGGMGDQHQEDLMDKLTGQVLDGELDAHPFEGYEHAAGDRAGPAAAYLGDTIRKAIDRTIEKPGEAMKFLQGVARVLAHEGKHMSWVSPSGLPSINFYPVQIEERLVLYMHSKGVKERHRVLTVVGEEAKVDKSAAANGSAPNYVHAHDGAHVHLSARACAAEGIDLATVHDSFACLPSRAARMNAILREQMVAMYEGKDLLREVYDRAYAVLDATDRERLPLPPTQGALDVRAVLDAEYAFA